MANVNEPFVINGNNGKSVQVLVTETIDIERNQSVVSIALSVASSGLYGYAYFIGGDLSVDGVALVTMSQSQGSWSVTPTPQNVYCEITGSPWNRVVGRNADGSKTITVSVDIEGYSPYANESFVVKGSVPVTLTQIPRASTIGATDANIGSASMIAVSRKSTSYTHSIQYSFGALSGYVDGNGNAVGYEAKTDATSIAFNVPSSFYEQIATHRSAPCTLYCRTYLGDTQIGETQSCVFWAIAAESACAPQVIGAIEDANPSTIALTGNKYRLVRYVSNALCTISAVARNAAYITSKTIGGTPVSGNTRTINAIDAYSVMFSATDSRGYSTNTEVGIDMIPYIPLTCVASGKRDEPTDGTATISVKGNYYNGSFGAVSNSLTIQYKQSGGDWVSSRPTVNGNSYTASIPLTGLDYTKTFTFVVRSTDAIGSVEQTVVINKGIPVFDWGENDFTFNVPVNINAGARGVASVKTVQAALTTPGWYRVGVLYDGDASVDSVTATARMSIGGSFYYNNATPAIVDVAYDYNSGYLQKVFDNVLNTHITNIRLCRIDTNHVAIDVYYFHSYIDTVRIVVQELQGEFIPSNGLVSVSADSEPVIASLNMNKVQTTRVDLLWVNATPGAAFPAQTIPLDLSGYDCVEIVSAVAPEAIVTSFGSTKVPVGGKGATCGFTTDFWLHTRGFTVSTTGIEFTSGYMKASDGTLYPDWDGRSVPYKIYGIKEGQ